MLTSLSLVFLVGLSVAAICERLRLPRIIGMLLTGIVLGPGNPAVYVEAEGAEVPKIVKNRQRSPKIVQKECIIAHIRKIIHDNI